MGKSMSSIQSNLLTSEEPIHDSFDSGPNQPGQSPINSAIPARSSMGANMKTRLVPLFKGRLPSFPRQMRLLQWE